MASDGHVTAASNSAGFSCLDDGFAEDANGVAVELHLELRVGDSQHLPIAVDVVGALQHAFAFLPDGGRAGQTNRVALHLGRMQKVVVKL